MLTTLARALVLLLVVLATAAAAPAAAGDDCHYEIKCDDSGNCTEVLVCPETGPGTPGEPGTPGTPVCAFDGKTVPCSVREEGLTWWFSAGCYFHRADPWPPEAFIEKRPEGAVYHYYCLPGASGGWEYIWLPDAPPGYGGPGVDPRDLAERAIASMHLRAIDIGIVPEPGPDSLGLVGMPTWMWVDTPRPNTLGPISESVSAGGITVTATARLDRIEWDMGDGSRPVVCHGAGTRYLDSYGSKDSPTCGHRYRTTSAGQTGDEYVVTASSYWVVEWAGAGASGTITLDALSRSTRIRVGEMQVLVQ